MRLNLLRIIRSICDASDEDGALITTYGLHNAIADLAKHDQAILVREMAGDLLKSSELNARRSLDGARRVLRRSSSSTMTPIPSNGSLPPTPSSDRGGGRAGSYFDLTDMARALRPGANSSPYRPVSREGDLGGNSTPTLLNGSLAGAAKSRLPRTRAAHRASERPGLASVRSGETIPNSQSPVVPAPTTRGQSAALNRRRRMTSQG